MQLINLTGHDIVIAPKHVLEYIAFVKYPRTTQTELIYKMKEESDMSITGLITIPSTRVSTEVSSSFEMVSSVPVNGGDVVIMTQKTKTQNLPKKKQGVFYIVSSITAQSQPKRDDLLTVYNRVLNQVKAVVGCQGLLLNPYLSTLGSKKAISAL